MAQNKQVKWYKSWGFKQVVLAILAAVVTVVILFWLLKSVTRHGKSLVVPDFTNMTINEAQKLARKSHVRIDATDSVYIPQLHAGQVIKQIPAAGSRVKKNRRILVTINSLVPVMVKVPNVVGVSLRQAESSLHSIGLKIGKLRYVSDIATNNVLAQSFKGAPIEPGTSIPQESYLDLTLGLNSSDNRTNIPNLITVPYHQVRSELIYHSLNLNRMVFDQTVKTYADTVNSVVYRQEPGPTLSSSVLMGTGVTIYLTLDKNLAQHNKLSVKAQDPIVVDTLKSEKPKENTESVQEDEVRESGDEPVL